MDIERLRELAGRLWNIVGRENKYVDLSIINGKFMVRCSNTAKVTIGKIYNGEGTLDELRDQDINKEE